MVRNTLAMVLSASILLTQSAGMLRCAHAGSNLEGHDPRPHFHAAAFIGQNAPGDSEQHEHEPAEPHDHDAVYLSSQDAVAGERSFEKTPFDDTPLRSHDLVVNASSPFVKLPLRFEFYLHPPDDPCPRYVRHLALLI